MPLWLDGDWRRWFYFICYEVGWVLLTLLLVSMCATKHVRRNPVLVSMTFSWWIGAFPNTVFLYITNTVTGPPPSYPICLTSAALVMAQTPLNASCAVALVFNVWSVLRYSATRPSRSWARTFFLVTLPYVVFLASACAVVIVGILDPSLVTRQTFYCVVDKQPLTIFLGVYSAICCIIAIILEICIAITLRRNSHQVMESGMDVPLVLRVVGFGGYILLGLALSLLSIRGWWAVVPDLCFSTFGIAFFLIFGSQNDILKLWRRWLLPCTTRLERRSQRTKTHQRQTSFDSAELAQWKIPRKHVEPEVTESWQDLEAAQYYHSYMRQTRADTAMSHHDPRTVSSARARRATEEIEGEGVNLDLHYVHTRESSNEADPEGNPFSSASSVSPLSPPTSAFPLTGEQSMLRVNRGPGRPLSLLSDEVGHRSSSRMTDYTPAVGLHSSPPPSPSVVDTRQRTPSPPSTPTLVVTPPSAPRPPRAPPSSWQPPPPQEEVGDGRSTRLSQIGMAL